MKYTCFLFIFIFCSFISYAQKPSSESRLLNNANEAIFLMSTEPEEQFKKAIQIEQESINEVSYEAELLALVAQCIYYKVKIDFEQLAETANKLYKKAELYNMPKFKAIGKYYLFESYLFNDLPEKAFSQLEEGIQYVDQVSDSEARSSNLRFNYYVAYSNYYLQQEDLEKQLKYIKLSGKEIEKMPEGEQKYELYYSNLAQVYNKMHQTDSAMHYSNLSNSINKGYKVDEIQFTNLITLGQTALKNEKYEAALSFFKKAEKINNNKSHINILNLYDNLIETHQKLNQSDSVRLYQYKKDSLRLYISESQNKFLHKLINNTNNKTYYGYLFILVSLLISAIIFILMSIHKNKMLRFQEKVSEEYLRKRLVDKEPFNMAEKHAELIKLIKENNPVFLMYFKEIYPDFTEKLLAITPKIGQSELEFCALLKLKIPTKEIAKYKFIEPKTVQNKRYLIRKKLNIPQDVETYQWFDEL